MRTSEFAYYRAPFAEFNVAQRAVVPWLDKDVNLVVSFGTAVGKTVLAECAFGYHLKSNPEAVVVYVAPFKSLASEKFDSWSGNEEFSEYGVLLNTGDSAASDEDFEKCRMVVITMESFDSKMRSKSTGWAKRIACVVFDEAHLIGDVGRGPAMEASMMRLADKNPSARMILLSATMGNAREIASWVKSLNGKVTKCVTSQWRPNELKTEVHVVAGLDEKIKKSVKIASEASIGEKVLVFVHSKVVGKRICKGLRAKGIPCAFHNASLSANKRKEIEGLFSNPYSGLDVLVSTSTLGAGVNL